MFASYCPSLEPADILPTRLYERIRRRYTEAMIAFKQPRRIALGDTTLVFECRETVLFLIHELARAENLNDAGIARALAEYGCLVPEPGQLTATLFIDGGTAAWGASLAQRIGSGDDVVALRMGPHRVRARIAAPAADPACPVHYLTFTLSAGQRELVQDRGEDVAVELVEPHGRHLQRLSWRSRKALSQDLRGPWVRPPIMATLLGHEAGQPGQPAIAS